MRLATFNVLHGRAPADGRVDLDRFAAAVRALDRVLLSGFYVVPLFHLPEQWIAYDARLKRPASVPLFGPAIELWWRESR